MSTAAVRSVHAKLAHLASGFLAVLQVAVRIRKLETVILAATPGRVSAELGLQRLSHSTSWHVHCALFHMVLLPLASMLRRSVTLQQQVVVF